MTSTVVIGTRNYSGETAEITFYPETGGTINVGIQVVPYNYSTDYFFGNYELFFSAYNFTCDFTISSSNPIPSPQTITATTVEYDLFQIYTQDPELFPNNVLSATTLSGLNTNILIEQNLKKEDTVLFEDDEIVVKTANNEDRIKTIQQMINYFVEEEEYEKCAKLIEVKEKIS